MSISLKDRVAELVRDLGGRDTEDVVCQLRNLPGDVVDHLASAFEAESDEARRALLLSAIWQLRDPRALPTLIGALRDRHPTVWKEALDGLVTLGGPSVIAALENASAVIADLPDADLRLEWCREALEQLRGTV